MKKGLNPCCNGILPDSLFGIAENDIFRLNPCCNGILPDLFEIMMSNYLNVLILVVMEYSLTMFKQQS